MHGKPNRTGRRAMNAMSLMAWNGNVVAGFQFDKLAAVKLQSGRAAKNHDPLGFGLVIPEAGRTLMRLGNDALDPHGGSFKQLLKLFLAMDHPYSGKNVSVVNYHQATSSLRVITLAHSYGRKRESCSLSPTPDRRHIDNPHLPAARWILDGDHERLYHFPDRYEPQTLGAFARRGEEFGNLIKWNQRDGPPVARPKYIPRPQNCCRKSSVADHTFPRRTRFNESAHDRRRLCNTDVHQMSNTLTLGRSDCGSNRH